MQVTTQIARRLFNDQTPDWFKSELIKEFGEKTLRAFDFKDITTFEDACAILGINPDDVFTDKDSSDEIAYKKLKVVIKAINNGWEPDWSDDDQYKYYPFFRVRPSGSGFSGSNFSFSDTITYVGSRLCTDSSEKANYLAEQFKDLYIAFLLINK